VDDGYEGGFQFVPSTWAAAGGLRYGSASGASPEDQARVFDSYEPSHPGAWPVSVPACSG
jgi:Transglycosylase-like domain